MKFLIEDSKDDEQDCELDSLFSIIVQIILAVGSFSILICKNYFNLNKNL